MNLSDLAYGCSAQVQVPGGEVTVRGLSLVDIMTLVAAHRPSMEAAFTSMVSDPNKAEQTVSSASLMGGELIAVLPEVAAHAIALATDQPENRVSAGKLPVGLQLALLEKMFELTAASEGGMGKVIEIVVSAVKGTSNVVRQMGSLPR